MVARTTRTSSHLTPETGGPQVCRLHHIAHATAGAVICRIRSMQEPGSAAGAHWRPETQSITDALRVSWLMPGTTPHPYPEEDGMEYSCAWD